MNKEQIALLPCKVQQTVDNTTFKNTIERNGGIIPLIPLIGAIVAGISALTSVAGTIASVVLANKQAN